MEEEESGERMLQDPESEEIRENGRRERRPVSFYDNIRENNAGGSSSFHHHHHHSDRHQGVNGYALKTFRSNEPNPSQAQCLNTTVPQNIAEPCIAGKHVPTRNSLRHSRMIVMSRNGRVPKKYLPQVIRYHRLAKSLVGLQTLLGFVICTLALWLTVWAPNLRVRDNPYWSGLPLLLSGIIGLSLLCCCRKEYPGMPKQYCTYSVKVLSVFLSTISGTACLTACAFAALHLVQLSLLTCAPVSALNTTCLCKMRETDKPDFWFPITTYHYDDLICAEVTSILSVLLMLSCGSNGIASITALWYVYLHWLSRYSYTDSKVVSESNRPIVISNT